MKKIILALCLIIGITAVSKAQMFVPEDRAKTLQTVLKLNNEQTDKITGFYKALKDKMLSTTDENPDFSKDMVDTKVKIKAVLTKEQNVAYEKWLAEEMNKKATERTGPSPTKN
jgi:Spy/CpxP family protein refolding chaperone